MIAEECKCLKFIDLPSDSEDPDAKVGVHALESVTTPTSEHQHSSPPVEPPASVRRRFMSGPRQQSSDIIIKQRSGPDDEATEKYLKQKISTLIGQTIHDTTKKVKSVQKIKDKTREQAPYKAGFILSMVRKSRLMLNDLFNLAVKHRDNWKALQQLKVFEYIVHTNVDTTNLVRQLVEIHINHLNSTTKSEKKRVVLL